MEQGLAQSRQKGKAMIMAGLVEMDGIRVEKAGQPVKASATIRHFDLDVTSLVMLDVGASTGGFTDCLLKHGALKVIAVDGGYGQLDWKLRQDPRVKVLGRTNIRYVQPQDLEEFPHGAVVDTAFISLKQVIPPVTHLLQSRAFIKRSSTT